MATVAIISKLKIGVNTAFTRHLRSEKVRCVAVFSNFAPGRKCQKIKNGVNTAFEEHLPFKNLRPGANFKSGDAARFDDDVMKCGVDAAFASAPIWSILRAPENNRNGSRKPGF
jgi:hypothetical protein